MDNAIATIAIHEPLMPNETRSCMTSATSIVFLPQHRHHFETEEQQREAGSFGMWLFLLTEIMFFGGMFFAYLLYRNWFYDAFVCRLEPTLCASAGVRSTPSVLITSGFCMAVGVWATPRSAIKKMLVRDAPGSPPSSVVAFLGVKAIEYKAKFEKHHHVPGESFDIVKEFINPPISAKTGKPIRDSARARHGRSAPRSTFSSTSP